MIKAFSPSTLKYGNKRIVNADIIEAAAIAQDRKAITDMIGTLPRKHRHLVLSHLDKIMETHKRK